MDKPLPSTLTDPRELARLAQAGSTHAFALLVARCEPPLLRYLLRWVNCRTDAEDLLQETFLKAYKGLHNYDPKRSFEAWLFTIAARTAATFRRRHGREVLLPELQQPPIELDAPTLAANQEASHNLWLAAMKVLPEKQYKALWLRYARDLAVKEVAAEMGITSIHAKVLLHRARQRLADPSLPFAAQGKQW